MRLFAKYENVDFKYYKVWSAYHFKYFQNNQILKSRIIPTPWSLKAYPTTGEVVVWKFFR